MPTLKQLRTQFKTVSSLDEAVSLHKVGDTVHIGTHPSSSSPGKVVKTNGFGHTHVIDSKGEEHIFDSADNHRKLPYTKLYSQSTIDANKASRDVLNSELKAKHSASVEKQNNRREANYAVHKEIINKLRSSSDPHLKNLDKEPTHIFDRNDNYIGSKTKSDIHPGEFGDIFHKIHKQVSIHNAHDSHDPELTHTGHIQYNYTHPGGGSNGFGETHFHRFKSGEISIKKPVHMGDDTFKHVETEKLR